MFNTVKCDYELPLPENLEECSEIDWKTIEFQSKPHPFSDKLGESYSIEEDGQLYLEKVDRVWEEDETHPFGGKVEETFDGVEKQDYSGELSFCAVHMGEEHDYFIEFKALFWKGDLKEITLEEWDKEDNTERVEVQNEIQKKMEKQISAKGKWSWPLWTVWYRVVLFVFAIPKYFLALIMSVVIWVERKILGFKK